MNANGYTREELIAALIIPVAGILVGVCGLIFASLRDAMVTWARMKKAFADVDRVFGPGKVGSGNDRRPLRIGIKRAQWDFLAVTGRLLHCARDLRSWIHFRRRAVWGRRWDVYPVGCLECGWIGRRRDMVHAYKDDGHGDSDGMEACPKCGAEDPDTMVFKTYAEKFGQRKGAE